MVANQCCSDRMASTQEGRGHNPVSTSKIGKIVAPAAVEIVPEKVNEDNGDADDEADQIGEVTEHHAELPAEHLAEPVVDVPEEQPEEPEQPEHLAEELEQPPEPEADADKAEQSSDQPEAKLDNSLEDCGTLTEDAKVEGQETRAFATFEQI